MLSSSKRTIATLSAAACLGTAGWAMAAGAGDSASTTATPIASSTTATPAQGQRPQRTPVDAATLAKITEAVTAKLPGATVERASASGNGYHAHVTTSDGASKRVALSSTFAVTEVADAPAGGGRGPCPDTAGGGGASPGETPAEPAPGYPSSGTQTDT